MGTDHTDRKWVIVRIDGKIASVSTDYRQLASISAQLAQSSATDKKHASAFCQSNVSRMVQSNKENPKEKTRKRNPEAEILYGEITATTVDFNDVWKLRQEVKWDDLLLFGTKFQKTVWRKLWELTNGENVTRLISYSDFADLCQNRAGVRAVAHAIGLNPISVIIPCHLVIPKESIDKMDEIQKKAESTIFKGDDLCLSSILKDESIDFGEYSLGRSLKRKLINLELTGSKTDSDRT